jgi:hypothetical protein
LAVLVVASAPAEAVVPRPVSLPCDKTVVTQPGGPQTPIDLDYNNCSDTDLLLTPYSHTVAHEGTYTWWSTCRNVPAHTQTRFVVDRFPAEDTNQYSLTNCLDGLAYQLRYGPTQKAYPCNQTQVQQPGGTGTVITVGYHNCSPQNVFLTVNAHAVPFNGTFTYVEFCATVESGTTWEWTVSPGHFPPVDSTGYSLTNCW